MINSRWYKKWHEHEHHRHFHWLIFSVIVILCTTFLWFQIWVYSKLDSGTSVKLPKASAVLSLQPKTETIRVGGTFSADIILDTADAPIDAVDVYSLHYDPTILKVIDDIPGQQGVQIKPGPVMSFTAVNSVEETSGTIKFGKLSTGGTTFIGKGVLATIHFQAVGAGTSYLKFDFKKGSTIDTNAAHKGRDQLVRVVDAIYTVIAE